MHDEIWVMLQSGTRSWDLHTHRPRTAARSSYQKSRHASSRTALCRRDLRFAAVQETDVSFFRSILGDPGVITDATTLTGYNQDWMRKYSGSSSVALRPTTTEQARVSTRTRRRGPTLGLEANRSDYHSLTFVWENSQEQHLSR